ncbi:MAG: nuclear transport factor 2 family protein [Pseudomonadota bacterium]|nr:nuclear transport factor 2 family protein [Pseudomonadota bacterium]
MHTRRQMLAAAVAAPLSVTALSNAIASKPRSYLDIYLDVIAAWKRHDVEGVLMHMADDIVWYVHVGTLPTVGKAAVRTLLTSMASTRTAERWRIFNASIDKSRLFVEGVDDFKNASGYRVALPYMGIVEFEDTLIVAWRDYFDKGLAQKMEKGESVSPEIEPLISRPAKP